MSHRSSTEIEMAAQPTLVFRLARDVERWAALLPHYQSVRVLKRRQDGSIDARFIARRPLVEALGIGLPVAWRSRAWSEPDSCRLRFRHLGGATSGMDVTWRIEPSGAGSRVVIEHSFAPRFGPWALFVERFFTRPIAGQTLRSFKAIAEALAEDVGDQSATDRSTYLSA